MTKLKNLGVRDLCVRLKKARLFYCPAEASLLTKKQRKEFNCRGSICDFDEVEGTSFSDLTEGRKCWRKLLLKRCLNRKVLRRKVLGNYATWCKEVADFLTTRLIKKIYSSVDNYDSLISDEQWRLFLDYYGIK